MANICSVFKILEKIMLKTTKLNPCTRLLYYWLQYHVQENPSFKLDISSFQVWTEEFLENSATKSEINHALSELQESKLVIVEGDRFIITGNVDQVTNITDMLPQCLLNTKDQDGPWSWLIFVLFVVILWVSSLAAYQKLRQIEPNLNISGSPYQCLSK